MFTADLLERAARTALVTFLGTLLVTFTASISHGITFSAAWWEQIAIAAVTAGISSAGTAVLALLTKPVGPSNQTASMLPQGPVAK